MSAWTPGPYVCRVSESVKVRDQAGGLIAVLHHLEHQGHRRDPDAVAHTGKLFAAAPDLYEALADLVYAHEGQPGWGAARAALAKARGER